MMRSPVVSFLLFLLTLPVSLVLVQPRGVTQDCQPPALSRLRRHTIAAGETINTIANRYNLLPATLIGFNPSLRTGKPPIGAQILVPPFNGVRVEIAPGQTWRDVARTYKVRPDVLFEVNGCQPAPRLVFVPGVNWSPSGTATQPLPEQAEEILSGSPLATSELNVLLGYGYQRQAGTKQIAFHGGIDLAAAIDTPVLAVGSGTVAFTGTQGAYGKMVVINHSEGLQTRYAQLNTIQVKVGQRVSRGQPIATVGTSGRPSSPEPHLHFEVRSRTNSGWVAENPARILQD